MKTTRAGFTTTALAALVLAGCNESALEQQGAASNAALIEGAYGGFMSGVHTDYYRLLLTDTELWLAYGIKSHAGFQAAGFFHSSGSIVNKTYTGSSAIEYFNESLAGTGIASAMNDDAGQPPLLKGHIVIAGSTSGFSAGPIAGADFRYTDQALLSALAGSWLVTDLNGNLHELVVDGRNGSFELDRGNPCAATGSFAAIANRNAYTGTISFGSACPSHVQDKTLDGVALAYANQVPAGTQLIAMFRDVAGNSVGYVLNGVR
jgi:uncharacterized protein YfiM (DUF2279 family)